MNRKFQCGARSFREFYPNPQRRHLVHHTFVHHFLPRYVRERLCTLLSEVLYVQKGDPTRFIQSLWSTFEKSVPLARIKNDSLSDGIVAHHISDLTMSIHEAANIPLALIQMPSPELPNEAFFVVIVNARLFTLESFRSSGTQNPIEGEPNEGVICEAMKYEIYKNHGVVIQAKKTHFFKL
jgi:hypothetical protein